MLVTAWLTKTSSLPTCLPKDELIHQWVKYRSLCLIVLRANFLARRLSWWISRSSDSTDIICRWERWQKDNWTRFWYCILVNLCLLALATSRLTFHFTSSEFARIALPSSGSISASMVSFEFTVNLLFVYSWWWSLLRYRPDLLDDLWSIWIVHNNFTTLSGIMRSLTSSLPSRAGSDVTAAFIECYQLKPFDDGTFLMRLFAKGSWLNSVMIRW